MQQPSSQRLIDNQSVTLEAEAQGPGPITFQWRFAGTNILGATNSLLFFESIQTNWSGTYSVLVTNQSGCMVSEDFQLRVIHLNPFRLSPPVRSTNVFAQSDGTFTTNRYYLISIEGSDDQHLYYLEKSTNLVNWEEIYGRGFGPEGAGEFLDYIRSPESPNLFYRVKTYP